MQREKIEIPYNLLSEDIKFTSKVIFPSVIKRVKPKGTKILDNNSTEQSFDFMEVTSGNANTKLKVRY